MTDTKKSRPKPIEGWFLVTAPDGSQRILHNVGSKPHWPILWEFEKGDPLVEAPAETLSVVDGKLVQDAAKVKALEEAKAAIKAEADAKKTALRDLKKRIRDYDDDTATAPQKKQFQKDIKQALREILGDD